MIATATTATGLVLTASKNLGTKATHVVVAHTDAFADMIAERDPKGARAHRKETANRFGTPVGASHIYSRHASLKAAEKAAAEHAARGNEVEVVELAY